MRDVCGIGLVLACLTPLADGQSTAQPARRTELRTWSYAGVPGFTPGGGMSGQIAVGPSGRVCVSYKAMHLEGDPTSVRVWEQGAGWLPIGDEGSASLGTSWYNDLAVDSRGAAWLVHRDYAVLGRLNVRVFRDGVWQDVGAPPSLGEAHYTRLALAPGDRPVVVYQERGVDPPDQTSVVRWDPEAEAWSFVGPPGIHGSTASYQQIAIDSNGALAIGFADHARGGRASVMRWDDDDGWVYLGEPGGISPEMAHNLTLEFDRASRLHVAYLTWHARVDVKRWDGSTWEAVGAEPASAGDEPTIETEHWRQWLTLDFDSAGAPYVAYQLLADGRAVVRRLGASGRWHALGEVGFTPGRADYLSMVIGPRDDVWVAFRDGAHGERLSVMRWTTPR